MISGFYHEVEEICTLHGYYAASRGNSLQTFRDNIPVPSLSVKNSKKSKNLDFLALENGTDMLSRNVDKKLSLYVV